MLISSAVMANCLLVQIPRLVVGNLGDQSQVTSSGNVLRLALHLLAGFPVWFFCRFVAALLIYSLATISFDERNTDPLTLRRIFNECNKILLDECSTGDQTIVEGLRIFLDQISSKQ